MDPYGASNDNAPTVPMDPFLKLSIFILMGMHGCSSSNSKKGGSLVSANESYCKGYCKGYCRGLLQGLLERARGLQQQQL